MDFFYKGGDNRKAAMPKKPSYFKGVLKLAQRKEGAVAKP